MNNKVAILMATYNGEKYLREQIESILAQTYKDTYIYIRDDNSTDNTINIIKEYVQLYPKKIFLVKDKKIAKGACKNFMFLLEHVYQLNKYNMFMFADQDDFWLEDKVDTMVDTYKSVNNKQQPILIHSDLCVVNSKLDIIDKSFIKYSDLNSDYNEFNNYLIQNNVTGCTVFINDELIKYIKFDIEDICMHDWYFALVASAFGRVIFVDKATIKYRQHDSNVLGAKNTKGIKGIYNKLVKNNTIKTDLNKVFEQAESFKKEHYNILNEKNKKIIDDFCSIKKVKKIKKVKIIFKNKFLKHGFKRIIGEIIYI